MTTDTEPTQSEATEFLFTYVVTVIDDGKFDMKVTKRKKGRVKGKLVISPILQSIMAGDILATSPTDAKGRVVELCQNEFPNRSIRDIKVCQVSDDDIERAYRGVQARRTVQP